ncbi:EF-hand domain-containing protein [Paraglaciecola polaris]|uniref:EF-hand domain-containing protein n=1 Tax=Paraglaciecola polaris LMG 21857 TaxID=1129793 RepID=K7A7M6_9ALTE|nr:hypothetical protein [Paraglaciecola polaris]GAC31470.1 hypothetical protein GPLA_0553 [Paraglaciecola polaris LMG 21857]
MPFPINLKTTFCNVWTKNADGQISIKEAVADPFILESFSRIDINGDGIISRHELTSVHLRRSHGHGLN